MSVSGKALLVRAFLCFALGVITFGSSRATSVATDRRVPDWARVTASPAAPARSSFCLPGEKVVCTLGPPPKCYCQ